jgi:hypothetical protein
MREIVPQMPDDDFEDRLRRSAGIPTSAARHALAEQKVEHEAEWDRDEPFRKELFVRYAERIYPLIQEKLPWAQAIAGERKHEIIERPTVPNDREILAQRWFILKPEKIVRAHPTSTLCFIFHHTGELSIGVSAGGQIKPTYLTRAIDQVQAAHIEGGFEKLLECLRVGPA